MFRRPLSAPLSILACAAVLVLPGCSRKAEETAPLAPAANPPVSTPADTAPANVAAVVATPAESSLAIKRGIATAAGQNATFRACDETKELRVIDEGDGALAQLLSEGTTTAYVEVYGERAADDAPGGSGQAEVFVLEQLLYAGAPLVGDKGSDGKCPTPPVDAIVTARGNEPGWTVAITETKASWQQAGAAAIALDTVQSQDAEGTVSYRAKAAGHELELLIDAQPCRDLVTDEYFAFAARAVLDGKEFRGCARVGK